MTPNDRASTRPRNATLKDVARLAGVSAATASKALNGKEYVRPETRRRVVEAAERIAFTPNPSARAIVTRQTGTIGLLTHDLEGRFSLPILMGAEDAVGAGQMSVFLCDARGDTIREQHHLAALMSRRVDGLIVVGGQTDPRPSLGRHLPVPVVYAYAPSLDPADSSVVPDNVGAGALAVTHLIETGRRRIAHVSGDPSYLAARERADGVQRALAAAGLPLVGGEALYGSWTEAWGRAATGTLIDRGLQVDAIVCASDLIARGALESLHDRGVDVPHDVAVVGFDNRSVLVTGSRPTLTSIDMNFEAIGRRAAERLIDAIGGREAPGTETLECRLAVRGSTTNPAPGSGFEEVAHAGLGDDVARG